MARTLSGDSAVCHRLTSEIGRPKVAKADLRKTENAEASRQEAGRVVARAKERTGLSLKEFAAAVKREERQVARWFDGSERAHLDALISNKAIKRELIVALAESEAEDDVDVETVIRIPRKAG